MSLNTFDKNLSQYERKMARQRKLEAMEAAAAGRPAVGSGLADGPTDDQTNTTAGTGSVSSSEKRGGRRKRRTSIGNRSSGAGSSQVDNAPPEGAIESARRFLWDEDEEDYSVPSTMFSSSGGHNANGPDAPLMKSGKYQNRNTMSLRSVTLGQSEKKLGGGHGVFASAKNALGRVPMFFANTGTEKPENEPKEDLNKNISPRRDSLHPDDRAALTADQAAAAAQNYYLDDDMEVNGRRKDGKRPGPGEYVKGGFTYMSVSMNNVGSYLGGCCGDCGRKCKTVLRKNAMLCLLLVALVALMAYEAFTNDFGNGTEATHVKTTAPPQPAPPTGGGQEAANGDNEAGVNPVLPEGLDEVEQSDRYQFIRQTIIDSQFSYHTHLDTRGTAANLALRWITAGDPANLAMDDDMIIQRFALAVFFFSTYVASEFEPGTLPGSDGSWTYSDNWMTDKGICEWYGIQCAPRTHDGVQKVVYNANAPVLSLNVSSNNVRGTIPREIAALEELVTLDLGMNAMYGSIPKEVGVLNRLVNVYLLENQLTGSIPSELVNLQNVRNLHLGTNKLTGTLPTELGMIQPLRAFGVDENKLTGTIPDEYSQWLHLLVFYVDDNKLTGTIPEVLGRLTNLVDLRLRMNQLTGTIPADFAYLSHLEYLYLDDNQFVGTIPEIFANLPRLEEVQLHENKFTGPLPESIGTLKDVRVLYMDNNHLSGTIPASYGNCQDLQHFYLYKNDITGAIPTTIGNMEDLEDFRAYENALSGAIPSELGNCFKLNLVYLEDNYIEGPIPSELGQLSALQAMRLYFNELTGIIPHQVCDLVEEHLEFMAMDCEGSGGLPPPISCTCCHKCYSKEEEAREELKEDVGF